MGKGKLLFKGEKAKKKKKKSKHSKVDEGSSSFTAAENKEPQSLDSAASLPEPVKPQKPASSKGDSTMPTMKKGTGKITSSGTVVTGHDTRFIKEVYNGDAIMCTVNGREELRVITMRLSDQSLNLSSGFSDSLKHPVPFQYIRKPRDVAKEKKDALKKQTEAKQDLQQHAFDLYSAGSLVYREKTETGSYRIKRQELSAANSRGDLLQLRAKKTSDKYC